MQHMLMLYEQNIDSMQNAWLHTLPWFIVHTRKSITLAYVLEVTVIHFLYVQITYVNYFLSLNAYFVFSIINRVFYYCIYITFAFVICLF